MQASISACALYFQGNMENVECVCVSPMSVIQNSETCLWQFHRSGCQQNPRPSYYFSGGLLTFLGVVVNLKEGGDPFIKYLQRKVQLRIL